MFEALEVGRTIKGKAFDKRELVLRGHLLAAQFDLQRRQVPVIIIVAGMPGAGKGPVVHRLNEWMDPRGIDTTAFWRESDEESSRPFFWRFWRRMPRRGRIAIFFSSWYSYPQRRGVELFQSTERMAAQCQHIENHERMLTDDGALIIKLWFHVSEKVQAQHLAKESPRKKKQLRSPKDDGKHSDRYRKSLRAAEQVILATDSGHSPWVLIEADDNHYRDISAGEAVLAAITAHSNKLRASNNDDVANATPPIQTTATVDQPSVLDTVDLSLALPRDDYKRRLRKQQARLQELTWHMHREDKALAAVFEGWDAAGKGSALRRVTSAIDPRLYK